MISTFRIRIIIYDSHNNTQEPHKQDGEETVAKKR